MNIHGRTQRRGAGAKEDRMIGVRERTERHAAVMAAHQEGQLAPPVAAKVFMSKAEERRHNANRAAFEKRAK